MNLSRADKTSFFQHNQSKNPGKRVFRGRVGAAKDTVPETSGLDAETILHKRLNI